MQVSIWPVTIYGTKICAQPQGFCTIENAQDRAYKWQCPPAWPLGRKSVTRLVHGIWEIPLSWEFLGWQLTPLSDKSKIQNFLTLILWITEAIIRAKSLQQHNIKGVSISFDKESIPQRYLLMIITFTNISIKNGYYPGAGCINQSTKER